MNVKKTHEYFESKGIIAIRADKGITKTAGQIDKLLEKLGNRTRAIPFYAIYPPGGGEPEVLEGLIRSKTVIDVFEKLESSEGPERSASANSKDNKQKKVAIRTN